MGRAVSITRTDYTALELRAVAAKSSDAAQVRRLLAIGLVLDGWARAKAAKQAGMDRQTLRDWVHRYNDEGIDGLKSRLSPGRAALLTDEQMAELKALVIEGPDPEKHKVVCWRCVDLRAEIARRFSVEVHESTVGKWLHELGPDPAATTSIPSQEDAEGETAFKITSKIWSIRRCSAPAARRR